MNHIDSAEVNITEDVSILSFLASHMTIIHKPRLVIGENRNHTNNNPNNAKSTNAVIFANAANPNIIPAMIMYFNSSFLSSVASLFCKKISHANNARRDNAITHKSVLLSTITRNAHIQLVNHNSNVIRHVVIHPLLLISG